MPQGGNVRVQVYSAILSSIDHSQLTHYYLRLRPGLALPPLVHVVVQPVQTTSIDETCYKQYFIRILVKQITVDFTPLICCS